MDIDCVACKQTRHIFTPLFLYLNLSYEWFGHCEDKIKVTNCDCHDSIYVHINLASVNNNDLIDEIIPIIKHFNIMYSHIDEFEKVEDISHCEPPDTLTFYYWCAGLAPFVASYIKEKSLLEITAYEAYHGDPLTLIDKQLIISTLFSNIDKTLSFARRKYAILSFWLGSPLLRSDG